MMSTFVTGSLCALDKSLNFAKPQFAQKKSMLPCIWEIQKEALSLTDMKHSYTYA